VNGAETGSHLGVKVTKRSPLPPKRACPLSVHDYLIDHAGFDWPQLLAGWARLLPREFTVLLMNRFGDLFLVYSDGTVHMLDVGGSTVDCVAASRDDFWTRINQDDNANQWLMIPLVDKLVAAGLTLGPGQCYGYKLPPVLGGTYSVENTAMLPITEHLAFSADLHEQLGSVPDGEQVILEVVNKPQTNAKPTP
jgi:hypothetical protein